MRNLYLRVCKYDGGFIGEPVHLYLADVFDISLDDHGELYITLNRGYGCFSEKRILCFYFTEIQTYEILPDDFDFSCISDVYPNYKF